MHHILSVFLCVLIFLYSVYQTWMDLTKEIRRQVQGELNSVHNFTVCPHFLQYNVSQTFLHYLQGANYNFTFNVKFYPPDPAQLSEDITR